MIDLVELKASIQLVEDLVSQFEVKLARLNNQLNEIRKALKDVTFLVEEIEENFPTDQTHQ